MFDSTSRACTLATSHLTPLWFTGMLKFGLGWQESKEKKMKSSLTKIALSSLLLMSSSLLASEVEVTITNLTKGIYFTPLLISAHNADAKLYTSGQAASTSLQMMAEGGDISGLVTDLTAAGADSVENPAGGLLAPAHSSMTTLDVNHQAGNHYLSIVAMMLPTNDGFIGLNSALIPTEAGTYKYMLNAHDAGTEANDEIINGAGMPNSVGVPAAPDGMGGENATGLSVSAEGFVHIHRGNIGDFDTSGGVSDLNAQTHRFLNPVASVTITVK